MFKVFIFGFILMPSVLFAQKSKLIGSYFMGAPVGDTISARLFISVDTFKLIYVVKKDNDLILPTYIGSWSFYNQNKNLVLVSSIGRVFYATFELIEYSGGVSFFHLYLDGHKFTRQKTIGESFDEKNRR